MFNIQYVDGRLSRRIAGNRKNKMSLKRECAENERFEERANLKNERI
jgi:hypothetical protein